MKTLPVSNLSDAKRLAARSARELSEDPNLTWVGEGHHAASVMRQAALILAELCPSARYLVSERAGRRLAWWWALDGERTGADAAFTTARWPSVARRRQAAAVSTPADARTREKS
jgi:hypothetical protein